MLQEKDIAIELKCQQFVCKTYMRDQQEKQSVLLFESKHETKAVRCPHCHGKVFADGYGQMTLKDMPIWYGISQELIFIFHRYECSRCRKKFTEEIPLRHPGTRITERAATWIRAMLRYKVSIRAIQEMTGIHWGTIRKLHMEAMTETLEQHMKKLKDSGYLPRLLAVDEFAIHKEHTYATCVMDLDIGEIFWVGEGRSIEAFEKFFKETGPDFLTNVMAVAMDMNASYNVLVKKHLPWVEIVYDRYHMQAQFGKEVLGVVRLKEAKAHREQSISIRKTISLLSGEERKAAKAKANEEMHLYSQIKKARWTLLQNSDSLPETKSTYLAVILKDHADLATCYAMKEEMCRLFEERDSRAAKIGWEKWFKAAKESGIQPLVHFANSKRKG